MATNAEAIFLKYQQYPPTGMCSDLLDCVHRTYLYGNITCLQGKVMLLWQLMMKQSFPNINNILLLGCVLTYMTLCL